MNVLPRLESECHLHRSVCSPTVPWCRELWAWRFGAHVRGRVGTVAYHATKDIGQTSCVPTPDVRQISVI